MRKCRAPSQALKRTPPGVTTPASDHHRLSANRQVPRPLRLSLIDRSEAFDA